MPSEGQTVLHLRGVSQGANIPCAESDLQSPAGAPELCVGGRGPAQLHSWLISMCHSVGSPGDVPWRVWGSRFRVNSLEASQILNRLLPACVGSCLQGWLWPVCPGDGGARVTSLAAQRDRSPQSPQAPQLQRDCCILGREFVGETMSLVSVIR